MGVVAAAGGDFQADQVGLGLVVAAVLEGGQLRADIGAQLPQLAEAEQRGRHFQPEAGGGGLGHALARVFAQGVGHFVAHDHGDFVVAQLELIKDAGEEADLAARHAEGVDRLAVEQVDFPAPVARALVPLRGVGDQPLRDGAQAPQLRVAVAGQQALGARFGQQLRVLLLRRLLQFLGRYQVAHAGRAADIDLRQHRRGNGAASGQQKGAARRPQRAVSGGGVQSLGVANPAHGG